MRLSAVALALFLSATACQSFLSFQEPEASPGSTDAGREGAADAGDADRDVATDAQSPDGTFCDTVDGASLCLDFDRPSPLGLDALKKAGVALTGESSFAIVTQGSNKVLAVDLAAGTSARLSWRYDGPAGASVVVQAKIAFESDGGAGYTYVGFLSYVAPDGEQHQFVFQEFADGGAAAVQNLCAFRQALNSGAPCVTLDAVPANVELRAQAATTTFSTATSTIGLLPKTSPDLTPFEIRIGSTYEKAPVRLLIDDLAVYIRN